MNIRLVGIVALGVMCSPALLALDSPRTAALKLEPPPKELQMGSGGFQVGPHTKIFVQLGHQSED